ncbi:hypothetical protein CANTEDRAFT_107586 [Yamadazyma tenuis ATCC 10573]|uniref:Uncharacterized protein n=1 Tax=Candida tenuis (strain ATCC 10573 / BCRC 21748 / CBS 615 / JCM 9827 / NBRC 10315 / NRRL Y-1498 / VKM Y-70) TaxID=590646 RepID=G3B7L7_CANTC|nr:uncharacterized protein CANTEDRAFT_107586 [Yamadazyma tenuis ATCC 10573]EGV61646.1 hypothetical protein CANTEDRAFT_107586 [Yamadazyma tenuis ATCC 10573]
MSKFQNSTFHREGKQPQKPKPKASPLSDQPQSEFIQELVETGRANWKRAPPEVKKRYNGIFLILFSLPILFMSTSELVRRLEGGSTKKVRQGELLDNKEIRRYDEVEKWQVEKNSIMYKVFGRDFFLDGFTSKTMKKEETVHKDKK